MSEFRKALELGFVSESEFDGTVYPASMARPYVATGSEPFIVIRGL
jgi:hypothetical protein